MSGDDNYSLRKKERVNYKAMHEGEEEPPEFQDNTKMSVLDNSSKDADLVGAVGAKILMSYMVGS